MGQLQLADEQALQARVPLCRVCMCAVRLQQRHRAHALQHFGSQPVRRVPAAAVHQVVLNQVSLGQQVEAGQQGGLDEQA